MCLIAYAPKDRTQIPNAHMERAWRINDDAWGIMYPEGGRVRIIRETSNYANFKKAWLSVPVKTPAALHFRYATSGLLDASMAHPFPVLEDETGVSLAVMHNGVMTCVGATPTLSDTAVFIRDVLQPQLEAKPELVEVSGWRAAMGAILGEDNKLLFMRGDGAVFYVNGWQGYDAKNGVWYSNYYSITPPASPRIVPAAPYKLEQGSSFGPRAWDDDDWGVKDLKQLPNGELLEAARTLAAKDDEPECFPIPNLAELSEQEIFEFVCEASPEDVTDAILDYTSGGYRR